ncbi:MAG: 4Fe-4S dicluster domain-containing protein [Thermoanaerobaculia bacterium]
MKISKFRDLIPSTESRRGFLGSLAGGSAAVVGWLSAGALFRSSASAAPATAFAPLPEVPESDIIRQQRDLQAALTKPLSARRWAMVIDPRMCTGCSACVISCRAENVTGPDGSYRRVAEGPAGHYPAVTNVFMPSNCVQCDDPPCQRAVPPGMITKRPDGIVEFDYAKLTGGHAKKAAAACPYRAVHIDEGKFFTTGTPAEQAYEKRDFVEYHREWNRADGSLPDGVARKCHFCLDRVEAGILPACVSNCPSTAMAFGDLGDAGSFASRLLRENRTIRLHEELGIEPRVHYIEEKLIDVPQYACATCH